MVIFSAVAMGVTYLLIRIQGSLPLNPQHLGAVPQALSFNTAASFMTNTNWQNYGGETTMSYFSQIGALTLEQMLSPVIGIAVAIAMVRGFSRRNSPTIGNFWVDMTRGLLYIVFPIAFLAGLIFVGQGAVQTLAGTVSIHDPLNGVSQTIPRGPIGFMEAIKQLGQQRRRVPQRQLGDDLREPDGPHKLVVDLPAAGHPLRPDLHLRQMVGSVRHGAALLAAMVIIFGVWVGGATYYEHQNNPAVAAAGVTPPSGTPRARGALRGHVDGAVRGGLDQHLDRLGRCLLRLVHADGRLLPHQRNDVGRGDSGGAGSGLYTILIYAIIAVFIGGLMIGRTPEYLGKKIQAKEVKLAGLGALVMPLIVLIFTAIAVSIHAGRAGPLNAIPHGFTEILYGLTSQGNNNGSAFGGLTGNTTFYNVIGGIDMLIGRVGIMIPALALGGVLAAKPAVAEGLGTFRTDNSMFVGLTIGVIVIIGGLTFFPALALGPIVEQLSHGQFF